MRRITTWALGTISALVLLFSYHTSTSSSAAGVVALGSANAGGGGGTPSGGATPDTTTDGGAGRTPTPDTSSPSSDSSGSSDPSGSSPTSGASSPSASSTYTGDAVTTRYGPVQVEITVAGGTITKAVVTQVPWNNGRDQQINSYAVPILNGEAVQAQSSQIDMISGATYTSEGYIQSLQSAIDEANL